MHHRKLLSAASLLAATALLVSGCAASNPLEGGSASGSGGTNGDSIVVASANFPENVIIGEIYAQALEQAGYSVERRLNLGAREVIYSQVESCALGVVPEYNQALLAFVAPGTAASGTQEVDAALTGALPQQLAVLDSSPAQDNNAIAVTQETATQHNLTSVEQLAGVSDGWTFGGPTEWETRADGFAAFTPTYGVNFLEYKALDYSGPITVSALKNGDVQAALLFSTAPEVALNSFVVLDDPKHAFGVNNVIPLVCKDAVPVEAQTLLNTVNGKLTTEGLTAMNATYVTDKRDAADIAAEWLAANGA